MIAKPDEHYQAETLRELLCDSLPDDQADCVESHLSECESCRRQLEQIAGDHDWWKETVDVLAKSTLAPTNHVAPERSSTPPEQAAGTMLDASLDWVRPLLEESSDHEMGLIDHYPVHSVIGQGGMGVVLRGTDRELNRPIAIKVLSPHLAGVGAARQRFMREAQAAAAVVHPSIVPIYGVATHGRLPYIVMPCITGGNLQQRIEREGPLELSEVLRIGLQISAGLAAAHRQGVIHRDIKPANILLEDGNGRVLISDFGLARALDDATLTMSGMIAGTPQYMSPEQASGEIVGAASDLFSLGSLLYALSTGRPPFRADSPLAVLRKITETRPRPIHEINEQMPAWLDRLVAQLMQVDPARRIAAADDAADLIRAALAHTRDPIRTALPKSLRIQRRSRSVLLATVVTVPLLVAGAGYWLNDLAPQPTPLEQPLPSKPETDTVTGTDTVTDSDLRQWFAIDIDAEITSLNQNLSELTSELSDEALSHSPTEVETGIDQRTTNRSISQPLEEDRDK